MIKCNIICEKKLFDFNVKSLAKKILKCTCKKLNIKTKHIVSYIFVDLTKIQEINQQYRNIDKPTDVISFAYIDGEINHQLPKELGDVFICFDKVISQAEEYGHSVLRECAFLMVHGILHLLGYDHLEKEDEKIMFQLQDEILDLLKIYR